VRKLRAAAAAIAKGDTGDCGSPEPELSLLTGKAGGGLLLPAVAEILEGTGATTWPGICSASPGALGCVAGE
jgi:hypothetical protein